MSLPKTVPTVQACKLLRCTKTTLYNVERAGFITRSGRDSWPFPEIVHGLMRYEDSLAEAKTDTAQMRVLEARAAEINGRADQRAARLCAATDLGNLHNFVAGRCGAESRALPERVPAEVRAATQQVMWSVLEELANKSRELAERYPHAGIDPDAWFTGAVPEGWTQ
jgi:hypothetical protein